MKREYSIPKEVHREDPEDYEIQIPTFMTKGKNRTSITFQLVEAFFSISYAIFAAYLFFDIVSDYAYQSRGEKNIGGEYIITILVFWVAVKGFEMFVQKIRER